MQEPTAYETKRAALLTLLALAQRGLIRLWFGDESGFSLLPTVPYGWIQQGKQVEILSQHSPRWNVFGLLSTANELVSYSKAESLKADFIIECLDDFAQTVQEPTVIVLDNASIHTSAAFQVRQAEWESKGVYLFFLPKYSPHLNRIERLWKQIKCYWLQAEDYLSFERLQKAVTHILTEFGHTFTLNFKELEVVPNLMFNFE